jgi:SAM-dependent methyltransferase
VLGTIWKKLFTGGERTHDMRSRNRYPKALVDLLATRFAFKPGMLGADVGAGTGRLSALFLEHGYRMIAIEPDEKMREISNRLRDRWDQFESCHGTMVSTGLNAASVDFVVSQRALYWPDQTAMRREFQRILRPGGPVALITDSRVYSGAAQTEAYENVLRTFCPGFREKRQPYDIAAAVSAFFQGGEVYEDAFVGEHTLTLDALIDETRSLPISPHPGDPQYQPLQRALRDYFQQWAVGESIVVPTVCRVACGKLAPS